MSSSNIKTTKYVYKSTTGGGGHLDVEYGTDLGALTRLEVSKFNQSINYFFLIIIISNY